MLRYLLSPDAYVCIADRHAVFLDLKRDQYTALTPEDAGRLGSVVEGWPIAAPDMRSGGDAHGGAELAEELGKHGLLTRNAVVGKQAVPVRLPPARRALGSISGPFPVVTWKDLRRFVWAWVGVTTILRCLPLKIVVERVHQRKVRVPSAENVDPQPMRRLMAAYSILQPNFFSAVDACLRNSLTFTEFVAFYGFYPTWVFGVRMNPFAAHSWVQEGDMVLNDRLDHVRAFTPIMTV